MYSMAIVTKNRLKVFLPLALLSLVSCGSTNPMVDSLNEVGCSKNNSIQLSNFVDNWNQHPIARDQWALSPEKVARKDENNTIRHCERRKKICLIVQTVAECIVEARVETDNSNMSEMASVSIDLHRRVVWSKLIKSFEPDLSQNEVTAIDSELYKDLRLDDPDSTGSSKSEIIQYVSKQKGKYFILAATPR